MNQKIIFVFIRNINNVISRTIFLCSGIKTTIFRWHFSQMFMKHVIRKMAGRFALLSAEDFEKLHDAASNENT